ncbi:MAG: ABC transporter ATP-binding protein [Alphaproteobacteria bacterium]|nr:ABC transporter ATP-binding protein [Alphaproteobacteria bacterium]
MSEQRRREQRLDLTNARRLWRGWIRPRRPKLLQIGAFMLLAAAAAGSIPLLMERAVNEVAQRDISTVWLLAIAIFVLSAVKGAAGYGQTVLMQAISQRVVRDMQTTMLAHLLRSDLALFQATASGRLVSRFIVDARMLHKALVRMQTALLREVWTALILAGAMVYLDWRMSLAVFIFFPACLWPILAAGRRFKKLARASAEEMGTLAVLLGEVFNGMRLIKAFRLEAHMAARAGVSIARIENLLRSQVKRSALLPAFTAAIIGLAIATVLIYGALVAMPEGESLGRITGFLAAFFMAFQPLRNLGSLQGQLQDGLVAVERMFALLDVAPKLVDRPGARPLAISAGEIRFEQVRFTYEGGAGALQGLELMIPAGKTVALVGASGAGKTTALNLIPRFFEPQSGRVLIDGQDVSEVTLDSLRSVISLVSQDSMLFDDSVRANIAFGRLDASEAEIRSAAIAAAAHEFIEALPQGYDTMIGERGVRLSGGQQQRLAIARAILKNAPILLLDEATSALDTESEQQVQEALDRLRRSRTTLVIAHRLSTVVAADWIYVIDHGQVVESGTHEQLKAKNGTYARLARLQFRDYASDEPAELGPVARTRA